MIANLFMGVGLGITIYYLVQDIPDVSSRPHFNASINTIPQFFSIVIFAMEAIGVVSVSIPRRRREDNIKMDLQEVGGGCGDWMELGQDRDRRRALVNTVRNFRFPKMRGIS